MKRRLLAAATAILLCAGCVQSDLDDQQFELPIPQESANATQEPPKTETAMTTLKLPYQADDSLNPYRIKKNVNRELVTLLYDSLTKPDYTRKAQNQIAEQVVADGQVFTVTCRTDALFSDGTNVTGADVVYSAGLARAAGGNWSALLRNVADISVNEDGDAQFRLVNEDVDFPVMLSFPIIKQGTGEAEYPIGVSRYIVAGVSGNGLLLKPNPIYYQAHGNVSEIHLAPVDGQGGLSFALKTGAIDFMYSDLSTPELASLSPSNSSVSLNNLVFLGANARHNLLSMPEFRHAISLALNRDQLVSTAYVGRGKASLYPIHPDYHRMQAVDVATPTDLSLAQALLDGLGLNEKTDDGWRLYRGNPVTLNLLINSENSSRNAAAILVSEQLAQVGIQVHVVSKSFVQYQQDLQNNAFDLYLGETRLTDNMDFGGLLAGGSIGYSAAYSETLSERYKLYRSTGEQMQELCEMFRAQSVFIPLLFRDGLISFGESFTAVPNATEQDLFYNISDW